MPKLLVIDDDQDLSALVCQFARDEGYETVAAHDRDTLRSRYADDFNVIVIDMLLPDFDGVEVIRDLAERGCRAGLILVSSLDRSVLDSAERLVEEQQLNLLGSLTKPFDRAAFVGLLDKSTATAAAKRLRSSASLKPAERAPVISADALVVLFQPKVDVATLDFCAVEALVRWLHPELGLVGPGFFIPAAERFGTIDDITLTVFDKALAQYADWMKRGLVLRMAVNLSTRVLSDLSLPDRLAATAAKHDVAPGQVILEVTETWFNQDPVRTLDSLTRLRIKGFNLSIDDFGTGYSSIQQLARAPFSELKIDRSFVRQAPHSKQARHILRSSVDLAKNLGLTVVAEGVETQDHWDMICAMGCDECQGFFIARPLTGDDTPAWRQRWRAMQADHRVSDPQASLSTRPLPRV